MNDYIIYTDSSADLSASYMDELGVKYCCLTLTYESGESYGDHDMPISEFYQKMRGGAISKTSAANVADFTREFSAILETGKDLLYLAFSSGLSTTVSSASIAAEELREKYPDRKILVVDTLCASAGQGLLVYLVVQQQRAGKTIEEAAAFAEDIKLHICHWFTVDDLIYLRRGGRISAATQIAGALLGIKPVMHVDNDGHLINVSTSRGRKNSLKAIIKRYGELAIRDQDYPVFISNGDCMEDARQLAAMLKEEYGTEVQLITDIGPVIGSHSGPGTLALFFVGNER